MSLKFLSTISGVPDRLILLNGQFNFVELKTAVGVLSKRQEIVFKQLADQGFPVVIIRSFEDVEAFVNEILRNL